MIRLLCALTSLMATVTCWTPCLGQANLADVIEKCEQSVVRIAVRGKDGSTSEGSGFVVGPHMLVTNVHVLMGARQAQATFPNEKRVAIVGTYAIDSSRDIAIARIEGDAVESLPALKLSASTARKGETVVALGSPLGLSFTATSGVVSALRSGAEISRELGSSSIGGGQLAGSWIQLDAALSPGNSGGPIINSQGEVIAMSTLASQGAQNLNFGISCRDINQMLETVSLNSPVVQLSVGVGEIKSRRSARSGGEEGVVQAKEIPTEAIAAYVATGKSEFRTLKRDLSKETERVRTLLKEMRAGQTSIPPNVNTESDIVRVPGKRDSWYFRSETVKRRVVSTLETQLKDLNKISSSTADANDKNALLTLLTKYGPEVDMRMVGTVGFLPGATVIHAFNGHEALVLINEVPCVMLMESTAGLSRGEEVIPTPVFVAGTATAQTPDGKTSALTVVQAVTQAELREVIFGKDAAAATPPSSVAGQPPAAGQDNSVAANSGARTWYDKSGKFSVQAVLLSADDKEVVLRLGNGKTVRVPRASLSEADQKYLRQ